MKTKPRKSKLRQLTLALKSSQNMTYKDLKRNVVIRGMPFEDIIDGSFPRLQNWLFHNEKNPIDSSLLDKFDDWIETELKSRGVDESLLHPQLRLGYIGVKGENGETLKVKRIKGIKKTKVRKEKTKDGIFKGTKKAYTFKLQQRGRTLERTIARVLKKFPDASEKSIKIWYKKSARLNA